MHEKEWDHLELKKLLEKTGVPPLQAEKHIEVMTKMIRKNIHKQLATKNDLQIEILQVRHDMKQEFTAVRTEMKEEFSAVRSEIAALDTKMQGNLKTLEIELGKIIDRKFALGLALITFLLTIFKYT